LGEDGAEIRRPNATEKPREVRAFHEPRMFWGRTGEDAKGFAHSRARVWVRARTRACRALIPWRPPPSSPSSPNTNKPTPVQLAVVRFHRRGERQESLTTQRLRLRGSHQPTTAVSPVPPPPKTRGEGGGFNNAYTLHPNLQSVRARRARRGGIGGIGGVGGRHDRRCARHGPDRPRRQDADTAEATQRGPQGQRRACPAAPPQTPLWKPLRRAYVGLCARPAPKPPCGKRQTPLSARPRANGGHVASRPRGSSRAVSLCGGRARAISLATGRKTRLPARLPAQVARTFKGLRDVRGNLEVARLPRLPGCQEAQDAARASRLWRAASRELRALQRLQDLA